MTSKKIAFIGCSFSSFTTENVGKHSWTYLLSKRFPQHQYRNYSSGGKGPDYFRICLTDAKLWNADAVFLTTTYDGRFSSFTGDDGYKFNETKVSENYSYLKHDVFWTSASRPTGDSFSKQYKENIATSITGKQYNDSWYKISPSLYNFERFWLLDFRKTEPFFYNHSNTNVWNILKRYDDVAISSTDDHWNLKGNEIVLNQYILSKNVKTYLT